MPYKYEFFISRRKSLYLWILLEVVISAAFYPSNPNLAALHSRRQLLATPPISPCPGLNWTNATQDVMRPLDANLTITCNEFTINVSVSAAVSEESKYLVVDVLSTDYTTSYGRGLCSIASGHSGVVTLASSLDQLIPGSVDDVIVDAWLTDQGIFNINDAIAWRSMTVPQVRIPALVETCTVPCPKVPCSNGGVCVNDTSCDCPKFYSGDMCEDFAPQASVGLGACGTLPEGAHQDITNPLAPSANISCNAYTFPVQVASNSSRVNYIVMDILSSDYSKWFGGSRCVLYPGQYGDIELSGQAYIPSGTSGINVNIWQVDASIYDSDSSNAWQFAIGGQRQLLGFLTSCPTQCQSDTQCQNGGFCNSTKCVCTKCWTGLFCQTPAPESPTFVYGLGDPCSRQDSQSMFIVLLCLYSAVCFVSAVQVMRLRVPACRPDDSNSKQTSYTLVFQHGTITGIGLLRALSFVSLGNIKRFSLFGTAFLTVIPYMMNFWIYSLLVLQWSSLVEQDFSFSRTRHKEGRGFRGVKCLFVIANIVVAVAVLVYFLGVGFQFQPILLSEVASIILCVVYSVTGISFLFYGAALQQELGTIRQRSERTGGDPSCGIQTRIKLGALSVSLSFLVESFIFASSINGNTSKLDAILSFFELWALTTILALYFQGVTSAVSGKNQKKTSRDGRSIHGGTRTEFSIKTTQKGSAKNLDTPKHQDREVELEHAYQMAPAPPGEIQETQPNKEEVPLSSTIDISCHFNVQTEPSPRSSNHEGLNVGAVPSSPRSSTEEVGSSSTEEIGSSTDTAAPSSPSLKAVPESNTGNTNGNVDDFTGV